VKFSRLKMARALVMAYRKRLSFALGFFLLDLGGQAAFFAFSMAIVCMVWVSCLFESSAR
jgi:hypothetical protein